MDYLNPWHCKNIDATNRIHRRYWHKHRCKGERAPRRRRITAVSKVPIRRIDLSEIRGKDDLAFHKLALPQERVSPAKRLRPHEIDGLPCAERFVGWRVTRTTAAKSRGRAPPIERGRWPTAANLDEGSKPGV